MKYPKFKTKDVCWYLPSLHAVQITDHAWSGSILFFEPAIKYKGETIAKADKTQLKHIQPGDKVFTLGYGESGVEWPPGSIVTLVAIESENGDEPKITLHGHGATLTNCTIDEFMRYAPGRIKYLNTCRVNYKEPKDNVKLTQKKIDAINKALSTAPPKSGQMIVSKKTKKKEPFKPEKSILKSAKTIVEEAKSKSAYNPEALAVSELMHEYEKLRGKYKRLLEQLKSGANVTMEIEKTEEEIRQAELKFKLGVRKFK